MKKILNTSIWFWIFLEPGLKGLRKTTFGLYWITKLIFILVPFWGESQFYTMKGGLRSSFWCIKNWWSPWTTPILLINFNEVRALFRNIILLVYLVLPFVKKICPKSKGKQILKSVRVKMASQKSQKILFDAEENINTFKFIIFFNSWNSFYLSTYASSSFLFCFNISGPLNNLNFYNFPLFCKITTEIDGSYWVRARKNP